MCVRAVTCESAAFSSPLSSHEPRFVFQLKAVLRYLNIMRLIVMDGLVPSIANSEQTGLALTDRLPESQNPCSSEKVHA